jgi:nicotinate-nucleotide pyrophosphorylase (carboxylating)
MFDVNPEHLDRLIRLALEEDVGTGDVTSRCVVPSHALARAFIEAKGEGVVAGLPVAQRVFALLDPSLSFTFLSTDGADVSLGERVAEIGGPARSILAGERTALNFLTRLSGVATLARRFASAAAPVAVFDTRKTTPGFREIEKYAVRIGGGRNHRMGLFDAILVKENHIRASGLATLADVLKACRDARDPHITIEVEVESLNEFREALSGAADIIMLDDMPMEEVEQAIALRGDLPVQIEVSGGVGEQTLSELPPGVDRVSSGALTHSAPLLDMALYIDVDPGIR